MISMATQPFSPMAAEYEMILSNIYHPNVNDVYRVVDQDRSKTIHWTFYQDQLFNSFTLNRR